MTPNNNLLALQQEWATLQTQFDSYEKHSLLIKLFNVAMSCALLFIVNIGLWTLLICALIWLQDGIWKTFQGRIAQRLESVECSIKHYCTAKNAEGNGDSSHMAMQFNSAWEESRKGAIGLVFEYLKNSIKPTVAYPHVLLLLIIFANSFLTG
ncbi:MAG: hypothetical protein ABJH28_02150 [Paraglaciecola sp.]|uniref:hypothetical protein n=1 Tax=Paraglaciecola sp. TaxID=1920173 RepID=UPI003264AAE0